MNKAEILTALKKEVVEVQFTKRNGELRTMFCTLLPQYLPDPDKEVEQLEAVGAENLITAWDVEENNWRSFRPHTIVSMEYDR